LSLYAQNPEWINYTYNENIHSIVGKDNILWLATSGGLVKFNTITEEKEYFNVSNSDLKSNFVSPIALDSLGNVWMWQRVQRALCFHEVPNWYLVKFDGTSWEFYAPEINFCDIFVYPNNIQIDSNNDVWIATYQAGIFHFDGNNWQIFDTLNSNIPNNNIADLTIDSQNNIWIGSHEMNGLIKFDRSEWIVFDSTNSGCPNEPILNLEIDTKRRLWFSTYQKVFRKSSDSLKIFTATLPEEV
jgi:ligand-binding sensor domain-containing protein